MGICINSDVFGANLVRWRMQGALKTWPWRRNSESAQHERLEETDKERQRHLTDASRKCVFLETELARLDRVQERERERELELASLHDEMEVR